MPLFAGMVGGVANSAPQLLFFFKGVRPLGWAQRACVAREWGQQPGMALSVWERSRLLTSRPSHLSYYVHSISVMGLAWRTLSPCGPLHGTICPLSCPKGLSDNPLPAATLAPSCSQTSGSVVLPTCHHMSLVFISLDWIS